MACCRRQKLTRKEKSEKRFNGYGKSLVTGVLASIVSLGLSAAVIAKIPVNAAMVWQLVLVTTQFISPLAYTNLI
jgi:hypothetical protein